MGNVRAVLVSMLAGMGIVLAILASFLVVSHAGPADAGEGILIRGIGNSGNTFGHAGTRGIARRLLELRPPPPVTDEDLAVIHSAILSRAREGDVDCAAVVLELCERQRARPSP